MILRRIVSALISCLLVLVLYFFVERSGVVLLIGMYLLPFLLLYGIPVSVLSDIFTKKLSGVIRALAALAIHVSLAAVLIWMLFGVLGEGWEPVNFLLVNALVSSFLFWAVDEGLKSAKAKRLCQKIDDLKIY